MPEGLLNRAALPVPSALPLFPVSPASVVTIPTDVILRMVLLPASATYRLPAASTATPCGRQNRAALRGPSALPQYRASPAGVVTTPPGVILRMVSLSPSATYTLPNESTATLRG